MCERCIGLPRRSLLGALSATLLAAAGPAPPSTLTGDEALHRLMAGNARYRANQVHTRDFAVSRAARVSTHRPVASILSCSDARVGPEFVFDQGPGDLFVVRVAGNVLLDEGLASLEYAAQFLDTRWCSCSDTATVARSIRRSRSCRTMRRFRVTCQD